MLANIYCDEIEDRDSLSIQKENPTKVIIFENGIITKDLIEIKLKEIYGEKE